jgi:hypothetical protein
MQTPYHNAAARTIPHCSLANLKANFKNTRRKKLDFSLKTCYNNSVEFKSESIT